MSLSGLRDLTLIETPPLNRYPIQTYVLEEDEEVIKNAIYKELSREGQTFILFNNIEKIEKIAFNIKKLVPDAKVAFAHGRMNKLEIETIMNDFKNNLLDVLVSTTIIENGIDIPNANTLIIYNADNFGLSQLYQIRGRIGRSNKVAYSYLMYRRNKIVSEEAEKRLKAIEEFTELGSGYDIALRDLSIRGAGDIFGKSQSGFVDKVGMNYYLKLMSDNLNTKKGIDETEEEVNKTSLNISTHIHDEFVEEEELKIYVHNLINKIQNETTYNNVLKELTDRFGKVNDQIKGYMLKTWFDSLANCFDIQIVSNGEIIINNLNTFITEEKEYSVSVRRTQTIIKRNKTSSETDYLKRLVKTLTKIKKNKNL
jgi:transcription-repair coupling factor (superfamily II helicase)